MGFLGTLARGVVGFATGGPVGAAAAVLGPGLIPRGPGPSPIRIPGFGGGPLLVGGGAGFAQDVTTGGQFPTTCPPGTRLRSVRRLFGPDVTECIPIGAEPVGPAGPAQVTAGPCPCPPTTRCQLNGRVGVLNKSRYFRKRDRCGPSDDPGNYELVAPGSRCVSRRSIDPGNSRAARRAVSRLNAHHRQLQRTQKALERIARPRRRRK